MTRTEMYRNAINARIRGNDEAADAWNKAAECTRAAMYATARNWVRIACNAESFE